MNQEVTLNLTEDIRDELKKISSRFESKELSKHAKKEIENVKLKHRTSKPPDSKHCLISRFKPTRLERTQILQVECPWIDETEL